MTSRLESYALKELAKEFNLPVDALRCIVHSFFQVIQSDARALPFDTVTKIHKRESFDGMGMVFNIPYLGRLGTSYSRYLKWRENESKHLDQEVRSDRRGRYTSGDIENIAEEILSGGAPSFYRKKKSNELYKRIWIVDGNGKKKLARQAIIKEN